jgi:predicted GNAT family N-acyltransferase
MAAQHGSHFLRKNISIVLANTAENTLSYLRYQGKLQRYSLSKLVEESKAQHQVLEQLEIYGEHKGIDKASKVRHLLNATKDSKLLEGVRLLILSRPDLKTNFEECARLMQDVVNETNCQNSLVKWSVETL